MNKNKHINNTTILTLSLFFITALSAVVLSSPISFAGTSTTTVISITVSSACSITANNTIPHTATILPGHEDTEIGNTTMTVECNDSGGSAVYAVGFSNDTWKNTNLIDTSTNNTIPTGTGTSNSNWSMKLSVPTGNTAPTIRSDVSYDFTDYEVIPNDYALVATFSSGANGTTNSTFNATYRAYVGASQAPGTYVGKVKYTLVHPSNAEAPVAADPIIYMQDMTLTDCQKNVGTNGNAANIGNNITVYDKRDEKDYTVKLINGQCWMTQNLRYLGDTGSAAKTMTIGNNNSNVANKSITLYSLNSSNAGSFNAYSSSYCDSTNSNNYACVYDSGNTSTGVWYNYYAASAGTISGSSNSTDATSDICPAGWHLPSGPNTTANTDYNKLVGNTTSGWQAATSGLTAFSAVAGGGYYNGALSSPDAGYWWSTTASSTTGRYCLYYRSSDGQFHGDLFNYRYGGNFVRCVMDS